MHRHEKGGSIVRIKLLNFLTYNEAEFTPGPHLNMVIGPNGTGKSSIMCAICLGLGGKTAVLGRQKEIGEFVKHGQQEGSIEIELFNPDGENYVVTRTLHRSGNTSKWTVNQRPSLQKAVEELVKKLNIQVNNLCQFLPQDKVQEFAKMSPQELLESTQRALATEHNLSELHEQLKNSRCSSSSLETRLASAKAAAEREVAVNAHLRADVDAYLKRQSHLERVRMLQMKRPWVEYEEKRLQYKEQKERVEQLKEDVKHARQTTKPLRDRLDKVTKESSSIEDSMRKKTEESKDAARQAANRSKDIDKHTEEINELDQEQEQTEANEQRRQGKIKELSGQLEALQAELAELEAGEEQDVGPAIEENGRATRRLTQEMTQIQQRDEQTTQEMRAMRQEMQNIEAELGRLQDVNNQRLEVLRRVNRDTYTAVLWLRQNQDLFKGTVHEPIMTLLNVKKDTHAKYIEGHLSMNDLRAFVCEDADDVLTFLHHVRDKQRLAVNAIAMPRQPAASYKPPKPISHYVKHGFYSYLREMIECPEAVMRYLCHQWRFHCIPVGNAATHRNVEQVLRTCPELHTFYTENHQFSVKKSKYGGEVSSRVTEIRTPHLLTVSYDTARETELRNQLRGKRADLDGKELEQRDRQTRYRELEKQQAQLREQKRSLLEKKGHRQKLRSRIDMKQQTIARHRNECVNVDKERDRINAKIKRIVVKKCRLQQELMEKTEVCMRANMEKVRLSVRQAMVQSQRNAIESELREQNVAMNNMELEYEQVKDSVKRTKDMARKLLDAAKRATNTSSSEELSAELKNSFESLPSTLVAIDASIHEEQARADCNFQTNENVVREYERREQQIAELTREITELEAKVERHQQTMTDVRKRWLEPLQELIATINTTFAYFFSKLNCAGEVDLAIPPNQEDYAAYGISIKVKFRAEDRLTELKAQYQSGGEKSVATVLYMMALQELTVCPFRCVDEINQGMDPNNERKVFELMVETACRENTSQYFLLTPKLLPHLEYSKKMAVLCVYNGPKMVDWNLRKFIKRRRKLKL